MHLNIKSKKSMLMAQYLFFKSLQAMLCNLYKQ